MIYIININVNTKSTDIYDKVAINKFPIIINARDNQHLFEILNKPNICDYIKTHISEQLYENAAYYIRFIDSDGKLNEESNMILRLKDYTRVQYN